MNSRTNRWRPRRRGTTIVVAMICLVVSSSLLLTNFQSVLRLRRQLRQDDKIEQVRWIVAAGVTYAKNQLNADPGYQGESKQVGELLSNYSSGKIEITIRPTNNDLRQCKVTASIDSEPSHLSVSRTVTFEFQSGRKTQPEEKTNEN